MERDTKHGLVGGFLAARERFPDRPALEVDGKAWTYAELGRRAARLAGALVRQAGDAEPPLTALFGSRSATTFSGVLAALMRGHGYVPLHPEHPAARNRDVLERSGARAMVVDGAAEGALDELLDGVRARLTLVLPGRSDVEDLARRLPRHRVLGSDDLEGELEPVPVSPDAIAYLLFTSGSTGRPKGVMVSHANVMHFVDAMVERHRVTEEDRLSQMFDLGFDLAAFDLFVAWAAGACVVCPDVSEVLIPADYVARARLSIWFSVPSTGVLLKRLGLLERGAFPGLRLCLFCGEALTADVARAWSEAAPEAVLENLYGPTEVTIACTGYRWRGAPSEPECENGVVPIGEPFPGLSARVVDGSLREVAPGEPGELLMAGPQVSLGYWRDAEKTAAAFVTPPGSDVVHYRTGDRVRRAAGGPLVYLGRMDHQIKVHGLRVELGEVEAVLREAAGVDVAVALGWPRNAAGADGIVVFLEASEDGLATDLDGIRAAAARRLPRYMIPREIRPMARLPLNANGKVDRGALLDLLAAAR
jgi:amino acid adenylation domain-containing protein